MIYICSEAATAKGQRGPGLARGQLSPWASGSQGAERAVPAWPFLGQMGTLSPPGAAALVKAALPGRALEISPVGPGQHMPILDGDMRPHHYHV